VQIHQAWMHPSYKEPHEGALLTHLPQCNKRGSKRLHGVIGTASSYRDRTRIDSSPRIPGQNRVPSEAKG
jgi:hypothetical protein